MNAIARSATYGNVVASKIKKEELVFALPDLSVITLILVLFFSALAVVYISDLNRQLFAYNEHLKHDYAQLQVQHDRLLLERGTLSSQMRIQQIADKLELQLPAAKDVVLIKL